LGENPCEKLREWTEEKDWDWEGEWVQERDEQNKGNFGLGLEKDERGQLGPYRDSTESPS